MSKVYPLPIFENPAEFHIRTWLQLVRVFSAMERTVSAELAQFAMTLPQFDLLATLRFNEGVNQNELADRLLVTKGNVCGLLDRLEKLGWVQRRSDEKDNRINRLHLTAAGRRKIDSTLPHHDQRVLNVMRHLRDSDLRQLRSLLTQLEAGMD